MLRNRLTWAALFAASALASNAWAQNGAPPRYGSQPTLGNAAVRRNSFEANKPVALTNKILKPVPLTADAQRSALANIDKNIAGQIADLCTKLKTVLPDELTILTKTTGWKTEDQQAIVGALRAGDPTVVYQTWVKGNPQDTAGAELAARQTDVQRLMTRLSQDIEKNKAGLKQHASEFDAALGKIAGATPAVSDLTMPVRTLRTWIDARQLIETATPAKGSVATLPTGNDVTLVFDPTMPRGMAIVLNDQAILIGREGDSSLVIATGNAAEALGLPIVTANPLADAEGEAMTSGVLLVNPASSKGTINYNIDGNHYVARPGMSQKLDPRADGRPWVIEYDRGESFGPASYTLSPGTYHFTPTDLGWQLYKQRFEIVLDNAKSSQEFNFIFQGQDLIVPAGGSRTLSSSYPVVVKFDRGNGAEFVSKTTPMTVGNLQIGVNASDNLWDLFPTSDNRREVSNLTPFNADGSKKR